MTEPEEPYYDPEELYGVVSPDPRKPFDVRESCRAGGRWLKVP